jgi:mycothiol system anti-sigma-R factor
MNCDQVHQLLHAYLDDELDLATALQIEAHLPGCLNCRNELEASRTVQRAVAQTAPYYAAPPELRARLQQAIRAESLGAGPVPRAKIVRPWWKHSLAFSAIAAALVLASATVLLVWQQRAVNPEVAELVDAHVRSLEASHLLDVESTDQHTVKPWFTGKLDFSPPVVDLAADGFPLIGGRLDYLEHKQVAALIYRHGKHEINVFIHPGEASNETLSRHGFNLIRFDCKGMICWAISDLNAEELQHFVDLFKAQKSASTRT